MSTKAVQAIASLKITETLSSAESPASSSAGNSRIFDNYNAVVALSATSTPKADGPVFDLSTTIAAGPTPTDFDLTAAPSARDISEMLDGTGKKLVAIKIQCHKNNNVAGVTIGPQGGNGYNLFGNTSVPLFYPGTETVIVYNAANTLHAAVAAGAKDIRISGAVGDKVNILAQFGSNP